MILRLFVGKNIKWGRGERGLKFGEENKDLKNGGGEEYQVVGNFIHSSIFNFFFLLILVSYIHPIVYIKWMFR